jgi:hypothetical protein
MDAGRCYISRFDTIYKEEAHGGDRNMNPVLMSIEGERTIFSPSLFVPPPRIGVVGTAVAATGAVVATAKGAKSLWYKIKKPTPKTVTSSLTSDQIREIAEKNPGSLAATLIKRLEEKRKVEQKKTDGSNGSTVSEASMVPAGRSTQITSDFMTRSSIVPGIENKYVVMAGSALFATLLFAAMQRRSDGRG